MATAAPLHFSRHRKEVSELTAADRVRLRNLIDLYINTQDPVGDHLAAQSIPGLDIHMRDFLTWHMAFVAKLELWLGSNGGQKFIPLPYWDPSKTIPQELDKGNISPNLPLPDGLRPGPIAAIPDYATLNDQAVNYHGEVHMATGGQMPFTQTSPSDPIFWPFHAFLVAVYEHWRSH